MGHAFFLLKKSPGPFVPPWPVMSLEPVKGLRRLPWFPSGVLGSLIGLLVFLQGSLGLLLGFLGGPGALAKASAKASSS